MDIFKKIVKKIIGLLMTLTIIIGVVFIVLFIFGIVPYAVVSGSMEPTIPTGSLCFINKHVAYEDIQKGDIIGFVAPTGVSVTHRVVEVTDEGLETKGDKNNTSDGISTNKDNYLGKNVFTIPKLGYVVRILQTTRGRIIVVTLVVVILISCFFVDDKKEKKVKEEK